MWKTGKIMFQRVFKFAFSEQENKFVKNVGNYNWVQSFLNNVEMIFEWVWFGRQIKDFQKKSGIGEFKLKFLKGW